MSCKERGMHPVFWFILMQSNGTYKISKKQGRQCLLRRTQRLYGVIDVRRLGPHSKKHSQGSWGLYEVGLMVEKKLWSPKYCTPSWHGRVHSSNGFSQTPASSFEELEESYDMYVGSRRELCGGKEFRKVSTVGRLLLVVMLGAVGIYICMVGVDKKLLSYQGAQVEPVWKDMRKEVGSCPKRNSSVDFFQHYPRPLTYDRQECACTPVHYFVVLSMQRSGSGWFETLLNNHPNISSHGEIFTVKPRRKNFTTITTTLDTIYNLDWYSSAAKNECTAAVGLKWMLNQGAMEYNREVAEYFEKKGVSVILLLRRNVLKRLISILANAYDRREKPLNGTHKSHVHSKEEAKKLAEYKPIIDVTHLPDNLGRVQEITDDAQRFFNNTRLMVVYYEDLVMDPRSLADIQKFLGVQPRKLESQQVKIHTCPLSEQIRNWDKVLERLKGTKFESLIHDDDYT